jgi:hypothetical protein
MEVLMFGLFKKSKVIRKSDDQSNKTETKWFKGQKVKIKLERHQVVQIKKITEVINLTGQTIRHGLKRHPYLFLMLKKTDAN